MRQAACPHYRSTFLGAVALTLTQASTVVQASMVASRSPVWPTMSGLGKLMRTWLYLPDFKASIASCVIFWDCMAGFSLKGMFWSEGTCGHNV